MSSRVRLDPLYRVSNEFGIPSYVIFDGDRDNKIGEPRIQTRFLMALMSRADSVPDHTIIDGPFAVFVNKWEDEVAESVTNYSELVQNARQELGLDANSGKPLISRYVARALVEKGRPQGEASTYVPDLLKQILEQIRQVQWKGTILYSTSTS